MKQKYFLNQIQFLKLFPNSIQSLGKGFTHILTVHHINYLLYIYVCFLRDESARKLYVTLETSNQAYMQNEVDITALNMIQTGVIPEKFGGMMAISLRGKYNDKMTIGKK